MISQIKDLCLDIWRDAYNPIVKDKPKQNEYKLDLPIVSRPE